MQTDIKKNELSGREIIICMFLGFMTVVLIFLFIKKQITRFTLKNKRGPHTPIGLNAPKYLKNEIDRRLSLTEKIKTEPLLISGENQFTDFYSLNEEFVEHFYRMRAIDELKLLEEQIVNTAGNNFKREANHNLKDFLLNLTKPNHLLFDLNPEVLNKFIDLYKHARHEPNPVFGKEQLDNYLVIISEIKKLIKKNSFIYCENAIKKNISKLNYKTKNTHDEKSKETCV